MQMTKMGCKYVENLSLNQHVLNSLTNKSIRIAFEDILHFAGRFLINKGVGNSLLKFSHNSISL